MSLPPFNKQATMQFLNEALNDFAGSLPLSARKAFGEVAGIHLQMLEARLNQAEIHAAEVHAAQIAAQAPTPDVAP